MPMGGSSMQLSMTPVEIINEIRLLISHPAYNKTIVLVEGESDLRFFKEILSDGSADIHPSGGKWQVLEIAARYSSSDRVVGLCDADFDHVMQRAHGDNVVLTDCHDLEMMMVQSGAAKPVIREAVGAAVPSATVLNLLDAVLDIAVQLGKIRFINERDQLRMNFSGLRYQEFVLIEKNPIRLGVDLEAVIAQIFERSKPVQTSKEEILDEISRSLAQKDKYQVCSGHDVTRIINVVSSDKHLSKKALSSASIERLLRVAYLASKAFGHTRMHQGIRALETASIKLLR